MKNREIHILSVFSNQWSQTCPSYMNTGVPSSTTFGCTYMSMKYSKRQGFKGKILIIYFELLSISFSLSYQFMSMQGKKKLNSYYVTVHSG